MKIILSPSKTKEIKKIEKDKKEKHIQLFNKNITDKIISRMKEMNIEEVSKIFKLSKDKSEKLINFYKNYSIEECGEAIFSYKGLVFKNIDAESFDDSDIEFAQNHLIILSALYGALQPLSLIKNYRLDMTNKIFEKESLYKLWEKDIKNVFSGETIINLASKEYSKMIKGNDINIVDIEFLEEKNGKLKQCSTASKIMRGKMTNYIVKNKIFKVEDVKNIFLDSYKYNKEISDDSKIVFVKM